MNARVLWPLAAACLLMAAAGTAQDAEKQAAATTPASPPAEGRPWTVPGLGLELLYVVPGSFQMGSTEGVANEKPVHPVRLSRGYWLGKYEVTQAEYETLIGSSPSKFKGARNPVEQVSWNDAVAFCAKLNERERAAGRLPAGYEYRLPTEAEWEYAARGGTASAGYACSGSNTADDVAWYGANSDLTTHPVGGKKANELGLYDLSGNVWEWCLDGYDSSYYAHSPEVDPVNTQATAIHVFRGGSWFFDARCVRSTGRFGYKPDSAFYYLGFRASLAPVIASGR